ncbi:type I restriction modification DNA specificity domain protein [Fusobacterium gonidiaformans 3-1-5R]|uniref:Type I restriction modification DNA specificity domain protein n=1 Tax=Fusobacterium gonidiaformans 3-1-5R TaxID=469605 RepID=E5BDY9_9FUSO|nr:restriction endonuclease subunit S [Fusobacterium gonidiaformans]EFS21265.1 type I restriction modification DNA specificity domain protein [Fusobacterium gonidiaformans 3-1-5R]
MAKKKELTIEEKLQAALVSKEEQPYEIPDSWVWVRLGSIVSVHRGLSYSKVDEIIRENNDEGYLVLRGGNLTEDGLNFEDNVYVREEIGRRAIELEENDVILVASTGSSKVIGRACIVEHKLEKTTIGAFLMLCRPVTSISKWVHYIFKGNSYRNYISNISKGSNIKNIKGEYITNYAISFPPIEEQQRIVKKLDFLFEKTKKAKKLLQEVKEEIEMRKISILDKAFRGELTKKWREKNKTGSVLELLQEIQNEKMKKWEEECCEAEKNGRKKPKKIKLSKIEEMIVPKEEEPYKIPDTWKWVKLGEISQISMGQSPLGEKVNSLIGVGLIGGPSDMGENYPIITRYTSQITKLSSIGDIIVSIRATLGKNIFSDGEYCLGRGVCGIRSKIVNNILLRFYFTNSIEYLYKISSGTTFAQVSKEDISNLYFSLPPLEEQQEIVRVLEEVLEKEKKVKELIDLEEKIDLLEKSILDKAFRGKLGTQDINDEPALELLKKIIDKEE